jgi:hypothetical protein
MHETNEGWSTWIDWPIDRDPMAVPPMVRPGDWVQSTLVLRPEWVGNPRLPAGRPAIYEAIWDVINGESFMISPPQPTAATHMVLGRFRVWLGEGSPREIAERQALDELSAYEVLMGCSVDTEAQQSV